MFSRFYADNYRCLSNFELRLEQLSILLGANGSGKSTVLELIANLRDFILGRGNLLDLFHPESRTRWDKRLEQTFELGLRLKEGEYIYRLRIGHVSLTQVVISRVLEESLNLDGYPLFVADGQTIRLYNDLHIEVAQLLADGNLSGISRVPQRHEYRKLTAFRHAMENTFVLALNPALVSAVSDRKQPVTIPTPDCSDFADWLKFISTSESLTRQEAEQNLAQGGLPGFRAFQTDPSGDAEILQCIFQPKLKFRLDELSSGQIALIILETALALAAERNGVLILDEPGNFLGLSEVQPLLTRLQDAALEQRFQVILTAHHPIAVDFLAAGHGLWLEREPSGPTRVQPIRVAESNSADKAGLRVSDLIARGWLSGLGLVNHTASSDREFTPSTKLADAEPHQ